MIKNSAGKSKLENRKLHKTFINNLYFQFSLHVNIGRCRKKWTEVELVTISVNEPPIHMSVCFVSKNFD